MLSWCQTMCLIGFLHRNVGGPELSGNVTLHMHKEVQITCKMMQSEAGLKKCFQNKSVARNIFFINLLSKCLQIMKVDI